MRFPDRQDGKKISEKKIVPRGMGVGFAWVPLPPKAAFSTRSVFYRNTLFEPEEHACSMVSTLHLAYCP